MDSLRSYLLLDSVDPRLNVDMMNNSSTVRFMELLAFVAVLSLKQK